MRVRFVNRFIFIQLLAFYCCGYVFAVFPLFFSYTLIRIFNKTIQTSPKKHRDKKKERSTNCLVVRLTPGSILSTLAGSLLLLHTILLLLLVCVIINFYSFSFAIRWMCLFFAEIHMHAAMNGQASQWARAGRHTKRLQINNYPLPPPPLSNGAHEAKQRIVIEGKKMEATHKYLIIYMWYFLSLSVFGRWLIVCTCRTLFISVHRLRN